MHSRVVFARLTARTELIICPRLSSTYFRPLDKLKISGSPTADARRIGFCIFAKVSIHLILSRTCSHSFWFFFGYIWGHLASATQLLPVCG